MAVTVRSVTRDSMPERVHVTQELERRYKQQEEAERTAKPQQTKQTVPAQR
jgi:hypothetical protein